MTPRQRRFDRTVGMLALVALVAGILLVLRPFVSAVLWAIVLTYSTWPVFEHLRRRLRGNNTYAAAAMTVLLAAEALGVDWRHTRCTVTGGLPFFGGAGNNYSMHAIATMVERLRASPGEFGLILANGGFLSKEAAGIYSTEPAENWRPRRDDAGQQEIDEAPAPLLLAEKTEQLRVRWVAERMVDAGRSRATSLGWPDAYAYTKALGERALIESRGSVPVTIVRPSIIESSLAEPRPGWIRGFRMAEPVIISYASGLLKEFPGVPEGVVDVIPVDLVAAAIKGRMR